jgi:putative transposase
MGMPRQARQVTDGGLYHVLTRGNNRQRVFQEEADYRRYLELLAGALAEHRLTLYHFALLPTQAHLVLESPLGRSLSGAMRGLSLRYTLRYQKCYQYSGHLWQGRFQSRLLEPAAELLACGRHVELAPVRAGLIAEPGGWPWSSYRVYAEGADQPLVSLHPLYGRLGSSAAERQRRYRQFVREGLAREAAGDAPAAGCLGVAQRPPARNELFEVPR